MFHHYNPTRNFGRLSQMADGKQQTGDDGYFLEANEFIFRKEYGKAERVLRRGLRKAKKAKDESLISFYLHALACLYLLQERKGEALDSFKQAAKVSSHFYPTLTYARMLADIGKEYEAAKKEVLETIELIPEKHQALNPAYSILGLCFLGQGNKRAAVSSFLKSLQGLPKQLQYAESWDLTLASALVREGVFHRRILSYLRRILKTARAEKNTRLVDSINELISEFESRRRGEPSSQPDQSKRRREGQMS